MQILFDPVWNWPSILLATGTMLAIVAVTYPPHVRSLSPLWRTVLITLRVLAVLLLMFSMLRPSLQIAEADHHQTELVLLLDRSRSMATPDGPGGLTRRETLLRLLSDNAETLERLRQTVTVRLLDFDSQLHPLDSPENLTDGQQTAIGHAIDQLAEQTQRDRLAGVMLISDGAQRAGGEVGSDPLGSARTFAEQQAVPIHTLVLGTSELSTSGVDLAVEDLLLDQPVTFEKKVVPVRLQLKLTGAANRDVRVRLLIEDRTGKALGESGPLKEIPLSAEARPFRDVRVTENAVTIPIELSFMAEQAGEFKVAAEAVPLDGEIRLNNNRLETLITVRAGGLRVAYFDILRAEQKFIKELNETAKIQLDTQYIIRGRRNLIDPQVFEPGRYDVYLIGDVPAEVFTSDGKPLLDELAARVREGAGLGMIGGWNNFAAGGYGSTPLADLLPVQMPARPLDDVAAYHLGGPLRLVPTRAAASHYLMRIAASGSEQIWEQFPPLRGANRLTPKSGAGDVLAESQAGDPLFIATDTGRSRVLALGIDETWRWHLHGFSTEQQRFWQQLVLWLARKEYESDQPIWARVEPRNFPPLSRVPIEFGAQDDQGNPIDGAQFQVEVLSPEGDSVRVTPQQQGGGTGLAEFSQTVDPGDYWVRVMATRQGASLGTSALTRFVVDSRDIEMDNPSADPGLMSEVAAVTGGSVVAAEEFGSFLEALLTEGLTTELQRYRRLSLWDGWPLLSLFVLVMTLEWALRKLKGLV